MHFVRATITFSGLIALVTIASGTNLKSLKNISTAKPTPPHLSKIRAEVFPLRCEKKQDTKTALQLESFAKP